MASQMCEMVAQSAPSNDLVHDPRMKWRRSRQHLPAFRELRSEWKGDLAFAWRALNFSRTSLLPLIAILVRL